MSTSCPAGPLLYSGVSHLTLALLFLPVGCSPEVQRVPTEQSASILPSSDVQGSGEVDGVVGSNQPAPVGDGASLGEAELPSGSSGATQEPQVVLVEEPTEASPLGSEELGEAEVCAETGAQAVPSNAALMLILDTSSSMDMAADEGNAEDNAPTRLDVTKAALTQATGAFPPWVHVGLLNFPDRAGLTFTTLCESGNLRVPLAPVGDQGSDERDDLATAVDRLDAQGLTPTVGAYNLGLKELQAYAPEEFEGASRFAVLLTDGEPGSLNSSCKGAPYTNAVEALVELASGAAEENITTFVLGSPGSEAGREALSQMAEAGGSASDDCSHTGPNFCHVDLTEDNDFSEALQAALDEVAGEIIACRYDIPAKSPDGLDVSRARINVRFTQEQEMSEDLLFNSAEDCEEGWFFSGDQVVLCSATCARAQATRSGALDLLFGCATRISPVR